MRATGTGDGEVLEMRAHIHAVLMAGLFVMSTLAAGCGTVRETLPGRAAMDEILVSTSADRAIDRLSTTWMRDKKVFIETANLECLDKPYVIERLRRHVAGGGAMLLSSAEGADVILEVASGAMSFNKRDYIFGIPEIPLPIPNVGTFKTPELALLKAVFYRGKGKLIFNAVDPATNKQIRRIPDCIGEANAYFWWILLTGPYEFSKLPFKKQ